MKGPGARNIGCDLFARAKVIVLDEQMRAAKDFDHANFVEALRVCNPSAETSRSIISYLEGRILTEEDFDDPEWLTAPMLVTSNFLRFSVNVLRLIAYAVSKGLPVLRWRCKTTTKFSKVQFDPDDIRCYEYFVHGAPAYLTENINVKRRLVNGASCSLHSLVFRRSESKDNDEGFNPGDTIDEGEEQRYFELTQNRRPGEIVDLPSAPAFVCVRMTENGHIVPVPRSKNEDNRTMLDGSKVDMLPFSVDLGFGITFDKAQGRTLLKVILNLNQDPAVMPRLKYADLLVGASRVQFGDCLRVLPWRTSAAHLERLKPDTDFATYLDYALHGRVPAKKPDSKTKTRPKRLAKPTSITKPASRDRKSKPVPVNFVENHRIIEVQGVSFQFTDVEGLGDCLYHSIGKLQFNDPLSGPQVRAQMANFCDNNLGLVRNIIEAMEGRGDGWLETLETQKQDRVWGGIVQAIICSLLFEHEIVIVARNSAESKRTSEELSLTLETQLVRNNDGIIDPRGLEIHQQLVHLPGIISSFPKWYVCYHQINRIDSITGHNHYGALEPMSEFDIDPWWQAHKLDKSHHAPRISENSDNPICMD
jgi:hypothetical protein